jgi:hypothetical protein
VEINSHPSDCNTRPPIRQIVDNAGDDGTVVAGKPLDSAEGGFDGQSSTRPKVKVFQVGKRIHFDIKRRKP